MVNSSLIEYLKVITLTISISDARFVPGKNKSENAYSERMSQQEPDELKSGAALTFRKKGLRRQNQPGLPKMDFQMKRKKTVPKVGVKLTE